MGVCLLVNKCIITYAVILPKITKPKFDQPIDRTSNLKELRGQRIIKGVQATAPALWETLEMTHFSNLQILLYLETRNFYYFNKD